MTTRRLCARALLSLGEQVSEERVDTEELIPREKLSTGKRRVIRVIICVLILGLCLFMALTVGDADYHATPLGWIPLLTMGFLIALAYVYIRLARTSLKYFESTQFVNCVRGEKIPFSVVFENRGPLILLNIGVELFVADINGDAIQTKSTTMSLGPNKSIEIPFDVPFEHIGVFEAGLNHIVLTDFLGLFEKRIESERRSYICVMPKVPHLGSLEFSDDSDVENFKTLKTVLADSLDYAYVRDYEPGDPLKTIHWKLSARNDQYLTRLYEKTISPGVLVLMDFYVPGQDVEESMELRDAIIESAFAVANYAKSKGLDTEICYTDRYGERRRLQSWEEGVLVDLVKGLPQSTNDESIRERTLEHFQELSYGNLMQNNIVVCSANTDSDTVGTIISAKQMRKNPFLVCAVPRRLVDRDLERHLAKLGNLDVYGIRYVTVSQSSELEGREM